LRLTVAILLSCRFTDCYVKHYRSNVRTFEGLCSL
jgi:hypothetical protein